MQSSTLSRVTGALFILAALVFAVTSSTLSATFEWPAILRKSPDTILTSFRAGGVTLIWTWFAVAWSYAFLLAPLVLLRRVIERRASETNQSIPYLELATIIGSVSVVASLLGFLRWVFVVPGLAEMYADPAAHATTREAVVAAFYAQHQLGGALLGEHIGQLLSIIWTVLISVTILRTRIAHPWVAALGFVASAFYTLNQANMIATAIPSFPVWHPAALIGSLLWAAWIIALGASLILRATPQPARSTHPAPAASPQTA
ncbi:MAG: DUF4386 domain-containing protein [Chloroflexi bacterium]|nr:MAG: DUF4386 domain-containing protein [Chloroflexota bacterium]